MQRILIFTLLLFVPSARSTPNTALETYLKTLTELNKHRTLIVVYNDSVLFEEFSLNPHRLSIPLYNIHLPALQKFNGKYHRKYHIASTYEEKKLYLLAIRALSDFAPILVSLRQIHFWRDRDHLLVLTNNSPTPKQLKTVFLLCFDRLVTNIAITSVLNPRLEFFTYNPFENTILPSSSPENLFAEKFTNLHRHQLKISMFASVLNPLENGVFLGFDGIMAVTLAGHLNASVSFVRPNESSNLAPVLDQFEDVAGRVADVGFNTRYIKFNFKNLVEKTYPHDTDPLACLVPSRTASEMVPILPTSVWVIAFVLSLGMVLFVAMERFLNQRKIDLSRIALDVFVILINRPVCNEQVFFKRKSYAFILFLWFAIFFNTLIVSRLTSVFTAPLKANDIETVQELLETDFEVVTIDRFEELLNASLEKNVKENIFARMRIVEERELLGEVGKCRRAVFVCKKHLARYAVNQQLNFPQNAEQPFYHLMKEKIFPSLSCFIVGYGSPLLPRLDVLVRRLVEGGIYGYWKVRTWSSVVPNRTRGGEDVQQKNQMRTVWTGLRVFAVGVSMGGLVFCGEVVHFLYSSR